VMLPTIPAPPGVGILKTMASASQAKLYFLSCVCLLRCVSC
jgi:hypothetical protein